MAELLSLADVMKNMQKKYGKDVITTGVPALEAKGTISLGSPSLDYITYNAIPQSSIIEISGAEGCGKTLLAYLMARSFIDKELERCPENPRNILFIDAEHTADPDWAYKATGYDMNRQDVKTVYIAPEDMSLETVYQMEIDCVKTGEIGLVIFDSMSCLATEHVQDKTMLDQEMMAGSARVNKDFVQRATGILHKYKCTHIAINGTTTNVGGYGNPETTAGGTYWKRACSLRLKVKKGSFFDDDYEELKTTAENPSGHVMMVSLVKSKFCRSDRRLGITHLNYRNGLDLVYDTFEMAIALGLIDNSVVGTFKIIDPETGEVMVDENDAEVKIRGKKNVLPWLKEHPVILRKLYDAIYEKISVKEDENNCRLFEKLLNGEDVDKYFGITEADKES